MNQGVKYTVSINQEGAGAATAAADLQKLRTEFERTSTSAKQATGSMASLNTVAMGELSKNAKALRSGMSLLAVSGFDGAAAGAFRLKVGIEALKGAVDAFGLTVKGGAGALAIIGFAVVALKKNWDELVATLEADVPGSERRATESLNALREALEKNLRVLIEIPRTQKAALGIWDQFISKNAAGTDSIRSLAPLSQLTSGLKLIEDVQTKLDMLNMSDFQRQLAEVNQEFVDLRNTIAQSGGPESSISEAIQQLEEVQAKKVAALRASKFDAFDEELTVASTRPERRAFAQNNIEYNRRIEKIKELRAEGELSAAREQEWLSKSASAWEYNNALISDSKKKLTEFQVISNRAVESFASGMADALVDFASGVKSAEEAFKDFARSFLTEVAKMIIQQAILNGLKSAGWGSSGAAQGGVFPRFMAAGGISMVSGATYFPKFNVVAGEAGSEWLTVLSRPRMMNVGGLQAAVGNAGPNRLALTNADDLEQRGRSGGVSVIEVRPVAGYEATIVQQAVDGAVVRVANDLSRDSKISRKVRAMP